MKFLTARPTPPSYLYIFKCTKLRGLIINECVFPKNKIISITGVEILSIKLTGHFTDFSAIAGSYYFLATILDKILAPFTVIVRYNFKPQVK